MDFFKGLDIEKVAASALAATAQLEEFPKHREHHTHHEAGRVVVTSAGAEGIYNISDQRKPLTLLESRLAAVGKARNVLAAWEEIDFEVCLFIVQTRVGHHRAATAACRARKRTGRLCARDSEVHSQLLMGRHGRRGQRLQSMSS